MKTTKDKIIINGKPFEYEKVDLKLGEVPIITFEQARNILLLTKRLLDKKGIKFSLIYGTLLGAIREHSFISHDYDVDIFIKDQNALMKAIPDFYNEGLRLCRVVKDRLYSFISDGGAYIDIYIMKEAPAILNWWCYSLNGNIVPKKYLSKFEIIEFVGIEVRVPKNPENIIRFFYGKTWKTPIKGAHGRYDIYPVYIYRLIKKKIRRLLHEK